jgi:hypothetical protein
MFPVLTQPNQISGDTGALIKLDGLREVLGYTAATLVEEPEIGAGFG